MCKCLPRLKEDGFLLDIGGGDGDIINLILDSHPALRVTMIDIAPKVGAALRPELRRRVTCLPGTDLRGYASMTHADADYVLISDVMHHIPPSERTDFLIDLKSLIGARATTIIIKDLEPGYLISHLSVFSDKYISGDRTVKLIGQRDLDSLVKNVFPDYQSRETVLFETQKPNYCLIFSRKAGSAS